MRQIMTFLIGICVTSFMCNAANSIYFYNSSGQLLSFNDEDIDSIAFSKVDTNGIEQENVVTQIIYAGDSTYRISIAQVDSIAFSPRVTQNDEYGITIGQEVDLGLPSGTIWAGWNVGASSPEEYGGFYAWGETEEKSDYSYGAYKYCDSQTGEFINIGSNISGTQYDVARQKWGGSWRMPTKTEIDELTSKCTWTWYQYKGVWGQKVTGPNGNSIFLPAAGWRSISLYDDGSYGYYWSATIFEDNDYLAWDLYFGSGDYYSNYYHTRTTGHSVRPVK